MNRWIRNVGGSESGPQPVGAFSMTGRGRTRNDLNYAYRRLAGCRAGRFVPYEREFHSHASEIHSEFKSSRLITKAESGNFQLKNRGEDEHGFAWRSLVESGRENGVG
ncbi:hypothetical protein [Burkholderia sp. LMG 21824]|uniref:hypothetical protein n=1 Tax=Burkholderia sp. LMG 21824 TaxID=3158172 RepID=UPI003C2F0F4A